MIVIDTNVLIYASRAGTPQHAPCVASLRRLLEGDQPFALTWINIFEFLRTITHTVAMQGRPEPIARAVSNIERLAGHRNARLLEPTERHLAVFAEVTAEVGAVRGHQVFDCRIAALMLEHNVARILTYDRGFERFEHVTVVTPGN